MDEELGFIMRIQLLSWAISRVDLSNLLKHFLQTYEDFQTRLETSNVVAYMWNRREIGTAQRKLTEEFTQKARLLVKMEGELLMSMGLNLNETLLQLHGIDLGRGFDRPSVSAFLTTNTDAKQRLAMLLTTIECEMYDGAMSAASYNQLKQVGEELLQHVPESIASSDTDESRRKLEELKRQQIAYRQEISRKLKEKEELRILDRNRAEAATREVIEEEGRRLQKVIIDEMMEREQKERERILVEEELRRIEEVEEEKRRAKYERDRIELERRRQQQLADIEEQARRERARRDQERAMRERELREKMERERAELERLNKEMEILNRDKEVIVKKRAELTKPNQFREETPVPNDPVLNLGNAIACDGQEETSPPVQNSTPDIPAVTQSITGENTPLFEEQNQDLIENSSAAVTKEEHRVDKIVSVSSFRHVLSITKQLMAVSLIPLTYFLARGRRYGLLIPLVLTTPLLLSVFTGDLFPKAVPKSTDVTIDRVHRTNTSELVNPFNQFTQRVLVQVCNLFSHTPFLQKQAVPTKTIRNQESDGD